MHRSCYTVLYAAITYFNLDFKVFYCQVWQRKHQEGFEHLASCHVFPDTFFEFENCNHRTKSEAYDFLMKYLWP